MRVLVLSAMYPKPSDPIDGVFVHQRVKQLLDKGHEVCVYSPLPYPVALAAKIGKYKKTFAKLKIIHEQNGYHHDGVEVAPIWYWGRPHFFLSAVQVALKLSRIIKKKEIDVVHSHFGFPTNVAVSFLRNTRLIKTYHGSDINIISQHNISTRMMMAFSLSRHINVFVSNKLFSTAKNYCRRISNPFVIPNGVSDCFFRSSVRTLREGKVLGFVGRLEAIKGFDRFINIINREELKEYKVVVVGEGSLESKLTRSRRIEYHHFVDQRRLAELLDKVGVLVMPSRNEGWPCLILEAYSRGVIVLATNVGGVPEIIHEGRDLIDSELDEQSIEDGFVKRILNCAECEEERNQLRLQSLNYSWDTIVDKEISLYGG